MSQHYTLKQWDLAHMWLLAIDIYTRFILSELHRQVIPRKVFHIELMVLIVQPSLQKSEVISVNQTI